MRSFSASETLPPAALSVVALLSAAGAPAALPPVAGATPTPPAVTAADRELDVPPERHQLVVFFAEGREPLTTMDLPVTSDAGEVGASNLYVPGDHELFETLRELGWTAVRLSERHPFERAYVISFPCTCEKGAWWVPVAARRLAASASVDSVALFGEATDGFRHYPQVRVRHSVRPDVPDSLEGRVWVRATVDTCGAVVSASVDASELPHAFERAALDAMERWRFEPQNCEPGYGAPAGPGRREGWTIVVPFRFER